MNTERSGSRNSKKEEKTPGRLRFVVFLNSMCTIAVDIASKEWVCWAFVQYCRRPSSLHVGGHYFIDTHFLAHTAVRHSRGDFPAYLLLTLHRDSQQVLNGSKGDLYGQVWHSRDYISRRFPPRTGTETGWAANFTYCTPHPGRPSENTRAAI